MRDLNGSVCVQNTAHTIVANWVSCDDEKNIVFCDNKITKIFFDFRIFFCLLQNWALTFFIIPLVIFQTLRLRIIESKFVTKIRRVENFHWKYKQQLQPTTVSIAKHCAVAQNGIYWALTKWISAWLSQFESLWLCVQCALSFAVFGAMVWLSVHAICVYLTGKRSKSLAIFSLLYAHWFIYGMTSSLFRQLDVGMDIRSSCGRLLTHLHTQTRVSVSARLSLPQFMFACRVAHKSNWKRVNPCAFMSMCGVHIGLENSNNTAHF